MKIIVQQKTLNDALDIALRSVPTSPQLPILANFLLELANGTLTISATDLYFGVKVKIESRVEGEGKIAVSAREFKKIINSLNLGEVCLEKTTSSQIKIISGQAEFNIQSILAEEFPVFPKVPTQEIILSAATLRKIDKLLVKSASADLTRPVLTTVYFKQTQNQCHVVCTDGFRLAKLEIGNVFDQDMTLMIPAKSLAEIAKTNEKLKVKNIKLGLSSQDKQAVISLGDCVFYLRLIDGEFPPYEKIIPAKLQTWIEVDREEIQQHIVRTTLVTTKQQNIFQIEAKGGRLKVFSSAENQGLYQSEVPTLLIKGEDISIAFNAQYILDFLSCVKEYAGQEKPIKMSFLDPDKPALFQAETLEDFIYVAMPFRMV